MTVTTGYDGYARLTSYVRSGGQSLAFAYNGLDDRVTMVLGSDTRRFVYDAGGRVLGEYGSDASDVKAEFIWLSPEVGAGGSFGGGDGLGGYMPLAVATPDLLGAVQVNWVHGNHLGVPLVITDSGGTAATTPNDYLAPGFPGQSRVLPDLFYNRYRDYDPVTGRYVQADPIGLDGGSNNYLYAEADPVNFIDPTGEAAAFGAAAGGLGNLAYQLWDNGGRFECVDWWEVGEWALLGSGVGGMARLGAGLGRAGWSIGSRKGLTTPSKYFGERTTKQVRDDLTRKYGKPVNKRPGGETFYNPRTKRSFNVHTDPAHGPPHVDIRRRGPYPERKYPTRGGN